LTYWKLKKFFYKQQYPFKEDTLQIDKLKHEQIKSKVKNTLTDFSNEV
jgi:hypothetical protein